MLFNLKVIISNCKLIEGYKESFIFKARVERHMRGLVGREGESGKSLGMKTA